MKQPKDHYVAETYLKWFADNNKSLWVYGKKWLDVKSKSPAKICKEPGGSDNRFLQKNRAIEDFLAPIENNWNDRIRILAAAVEISSEAYLDAKFTVCSYMAYLRFHTPATVRIEQAALAAILKSTFKLLNDAGKFPPPPVGLENITDTIDESCFTADGKFPRAIAASILHKAATNFFKSPMILLHNQNKMPFLTSDNPLCLWYHNNATYPTLYLPLTPRVAVLVKPFTEKERTASYDHSLDHSAVPKPELIQILNKQTAKHAEQIVISNQRRDDVLALVSEHRDWHFANLTKTVPVPGGKIIINTSRAIKKNI